MAIRVLSFACYACLLAMTIYISVSRAQSVPYFDSISEMRDRMRLGIGYGLKDVTAGRSMEFDIEVDNKVYPIELLEQGVNNIVDLPTFTVDRQVPLIDDPNLVKHLPSLAPFQLVGPMELSISDAKDMRLSLPHDVDVSEVKKVTLAQHVVVTVKGAKSISLQHPIELPLPFNKTHGSYFASSLQSLGNYLQNATRTQTQLVSVGIVGPTSLHSPVKLKLKHFDPGLVELSTFRKPDSENALCSMETLSLWHVAPVDRSNKNLYGLETLLSSETVSSFKVLKAKVSSHIFLSIRFEDVYKMTRNRSIIVKPETHYEILAKVDGHRVAPVIIEATDC